MILQAGVIGYLYFGRFFHVNVFVDVFLDECFFFVLLSLGDLFLELFLISQHILLIADVVFFEQLHELPPVLLGVELLGLEQDQFAVHYRGFVVDFKERLSVGFVCFGLFGQDGFFSFLLQSELVLGGDGVLAGVFWGGETVAESLHDLVLIVLGFEELVREGAFQHFVFFVFGHGRNTGNQESVSIYLILCQPRFKIMWKINIFLLICLLAFISTGDCFQDPDDDDLDLDTSQPEKEDESESEDQSDEDSADKLRHTSHMLDFQQLQHEVDHLIGFEEEKRDEEGHTLHPADLTNLKKIFHNNKKWCHQKLKKDPTFFKKHELIQKPNYLWIGCSDSRLPANQILGLDYGEVFVLRNVANMVSPSDISVLAVIQYAVEELKVKDIIVAGHYGCGGVKAAVTKYNHGPLEAWLSKLRRIRHKHAHAFSHLETLEEKAELLVEINVKQQVFNVASTPFVQQAWLKGQELRVHGVVFDMETGRLIDLHVTMHSIEQVPQELAVFEK